MRKRIVVVCLGTKNMFRGPDVLVHGLGLEAGTWLLNSDKLKLRGIGEWVAEKNFAYAHRKLSETPITFITNLTSANEAGDAVLEALSTMHFLGVEPLENVIIIHDDLDVPAYEVKGVNSPLVGNLHRPVSSVLRALGSEAPKRIKIGAQGMKLTDVVNFVIETYQRTSFPKVLEQLQRMVEEKERLEDFEQYVESRVEVMRQLVRDSDEKMTELVTGLNSTGRAINAFVPPAFALLTWQQAEALKQAVATITEAIQHIAEGHRLGLNVPGRNSLIEALEKNMSPQLVAALRGQGVRLPFLNIDFHIGEDGITPQLIEMNSTQGGLLDELALYHTLENDVAKTSLQTVENPIRMADLVESMVSPYVREGDDVIWVVDATRDDKMDWVIYHMLGNLGYNVVWAPPSAGIIGSIGSKKRLCIQNKPVRLVFNMVRSSKDFSEDALYAFAQNLVSVTPSLGLRAFTNKHFLTLLGNEQTRRQEFGMDERLSAEIAKLLPLCELVTPQNEQLIRWMVNAGVKVPIKPLSGGGGSRGYHLLQKSDPNTGTALLTALKSGNYIVQKYAHRYSLPTTPYQFDVRVTLFPIKGKMHAHYAARIYRVGEMAMLGSAPVLVIPKPEKPKKSTPCQCNNCGNGFPMNMMGQTCPRCRDGEIVEKVAELS